MKIKTKNKKKLKRIKSPKKRITVGILLKQVSKHGLFINNLFQLDDGSWQANLRAKFGKARTEYYQFGRGSTPLRALKRAIKLAKKDKRWRE